MIIYFAVYLFLFFLSTIRYNSFVGLLACFPLFIMLAFKGEVGCDYAGYYNHYLTFELGKSIFDLRGEMVWYAVEWIVDSFGLSYQYYYIFSALIAFPFLLMTQRYTRSLNVLILIYPILFIQLGLSGIRQFIAVCIGTYILARYLYRPPKSINLYIFFTALATTFHVSAILLLIVLPFLVKLKPYLIVITVAIGLLIFRTSFAEEVYATYEFRYLTRTRTSSGAWIRFALTAGIFVLGVFQRKHPYFWLAVAILGMGVAIGLINSITLHRLNYYFYPIAVLLLARTAASFPREKRLSVQVAYALTIGYMSFWFLLSTHSDCLIPYSFSFFQ